MRYLALLLLTSSLFADISHLSLNEALQIAMQGNKEILIAESEVDVYRARHLQAISAWLPSINFSSMRAKMQDPIRFIHGKRTTIQNNQFHLSQPVFSSDLIFGLRSAKYYWQSMKADQTMAINDTCYQVRSLYYAVVLKEISLAVQEEIVNYLKGALCDEQIKFEVGRTIDFEVNQIKVALNSAISNYHALMKTRNDAYADLILALGVDPKMGREIHVSETELPFPPELQPKLQLLQQKTQDLTLITPELSLYSQEEIEKLVFMARQKRPEIKKTEILVEAAREEVRSKKAKYLPTVSAFVDYGYFPPTRGFYFRQENNFVGGFLLNWDIFDSFKREFHIFEASAASKVAGLVRDLQLDKTEIHIRSLVTQIEEALFSYSTAHAGMLLACQAMSDSKVRLSSGTITPLQFREATRSYAESHRQSDEALYVLLHAYFKLQHDTGSYLQ